GVLDALTQFIQLLETFLHAFAIAEYAEVKLHRVLQILTNIRYTLAAARGIEAIQTRHGHFNVRFGRILNTEAFPQHLLDVQTSSATEYHQVKQRVTAQAVSAVNRHTGSFATSKQTIDDLVNAIGVLSQRLTADVGRNTAHHVVTGRHNRNRLFHRIHMGKGLGQFTNTWQTQIQ